MRRTESEQEQTSVLYISYTKYLLYIDNVAHVAFEKTPQSGATRSPCVSGWCLTLLPGSVLNTSRTLAFPISTLNDLVKGSHSDFLAR